MNILLIGMHFHEYEKKIKNAYESEGHNVCLIYDSKSYKKRFESEEFFKKRNYRYQKKILLKIENNFDKVIVIVGRFLSEEFLKNLRNLNKKAQFILYLWDDVARVQNFFDTKKYYDVIFSFDDEDCLKYGFNFLPLFYAKEFSDRLGHNITRKIDIYGSYWNHSDRIEIIKKIAINEINKKNYFYIVVGPFFLLKKILLLFFKKINGIHFTLFSISFAKNVKNMQNAFSVLDIQFPSQKGLTLRTLEAIGSETKIITTNSAIKNYDFYNENNICVIDRENPIIPKQFFTTPYSRIDIGIYKKYSILNWTEELISK